MENKTPKEKLFGCFLGQPLEIVKKLLGGAQKYNVTMTELDALLYQN